MDYKTKNIIEKKTIFWETDFPYISTYLFYREFPVIRELVNILKTEPTVFMFDGNGILHPYEIGLATQAGIALNKPSIGIAKRLLYGDISGNVVKINGEKKGNTYFSRTTMNAAHEAVFRKALEYAKVRVQWGKPIFEHQLVMKKFFDLFAAIESARALLWKASWLCKTSFPGDLKMSLTAKIYATTEAVKHTSEMVQVLAGYGISKEYTLEKYARDAKLLPVMDGTNETLMLKAASHF